MGLPIANLDQIEEEHYHSEDDAIALGISVGNSESDQRTADTENSNVVYAANLQNSLEDSSPTERLFLDAPQICQAEDDAVLPVDTYIVPPEHAGTRVETENAHHLVFPEADAIQNAIEILAKSF